MGKGVGKGWRLAARPACTYASSDHKFALSSWSSPNPRCSLALPYFAILVHVAPAIPVLALARLQPEIHCRPSSLDTLRAHLIQAITSRTLSYPHNDVLLVVDDHLARP